MKKLLSLILASALLVTPAFAKTEVKTGAEKSAAVAMPRAEKATPKKGSASASDIVRGFYGQLQNVMQKGDQLGFQGRYDQLKPAIEKSFDLAQMTRFAVGPSWNKASTDEQDKLIAAFSAFSIANYATRFKTHHGEQFIVSGEKQARDGSLIVETSLLPKDDKPVTLNYLMRKNAQGQWRITDVYLDATISELATRRAEFSAIMTREGVDALIGKLSQKTDAMRAS